MARETRSNEILLESGTNELEVMEFTIAGNPFGINVAKVIEIMQYEHCNPMPNSHPYVEGIFKPRDHIITVIDLPGYLGLPPAEDDTRNMFIITKFNKMLAAFHVHSVNTIHRVSWKDIEKPDRTIYGGEESLATGIVSIKDKIITIIDFERVLFDICPASGIRLSEIDELGPRGNSEKPILIAEDSPLLKRLIVDALHQAGYANIVICANGQEAWNKLKDWKGQGNVENFCKCIVTDIEMPKMDGHRLTKLVKEDPALQKLPVIIFSSLIDRAMYEKGLSLGADAQLSKPEVGNLVLLVDRLIL